MTDSDPIDATVGRLAELAKRHGWTVAAAESLTSGAVASALGRAKDASSWFAGGMVAYLTTVKREVLGVTSERVVTAAAAEQMARGVLDLTSADLAVATTGVGGPGSEEGQPAGTVWLGVASRLGSRAERHHFEGDPATVVREATRAAVELALAEARRLAPAAPVQVS